MPSAEAVADRVIAAVRTVVGQFGKAPLHRPFIDAGDMAAVARADPVGYGEIAEFEELLAATCGVKYAVALSSGTAALHLSMLALGVRAGTLVGLPDMTFVAAAAAACYCNAIPVFGGDHLTELGDHQFGAIVKLDLLGYPMAYDAGPLPVIEDAAAALGSRWRGQPCGSFGDIGIVSFNHNKIIATGGGGSILTDRLDLAERIRFLASTAKTPSPFFFSHEAIGYNYRISNLAAALGLNQLRRLDAILQIKQTIHENYLAAFERIDEAALWIDPVWSKSNHWLNAITVAPELRDPLLRALAAAGLGARALYTPLHMQAPYGHFPVTPAARAEATALFETTICLPSGKR